MEPPVQRARLGQVVDTEMQELLAFQDQAVSEEQLREQP